MTTIRERLTAILSEIDKASIEADDSWWDTSVGAEFGRQKLEEVITYCESLVPARTTKKPNMEGADAMSEHEWVDISVHGSIYDEQMALDVVPTRYRHRRRLYNVNMGTTRFGLCVQTEWIDGRRPDIPLEPPR